MCLADGRFQSRDLRLGVLQQRGGLGGVEFCHCPPLELGVGNVVAALLNRDVGFGDFQLFLENAELHIIGGDLGDKTDKDVIVRGHGSEQLSVSRLDGAAKAAPEVEFPGGLKAQSANHQTCSGG